MRFPPPVPVDVDSVCCCCRPFRLSTVNARAVTTIPQITVATKANNRALATLKCGASSGVSSSADRCFDVVNRNFGLTATRITKHKTNTMAHATSREYTGWRYQSTLGLSAWDLTPLGNTAALRVGGKTGGGTSTFSSKTPGLYVLSFPAPPSPSLNDAFQASVTMLDVSSAELICVCACLFLPLCDYHYYVPCQHKKNMSLNSHRGVATTFSLQGKFYPLLDTHGASALQSQLQTSVPMAILSSLAAQRAARQPH